MVVQLLLNPERAARLVEQHALDPKLPGLESVLDRLIATTFDPPATGYEAEIGRAVQRVVVDRLMGLAVSAGMGQVRAVATAKLGQLASRPLPAAVRTPDNQAARALFAADIRRFQARPYDPPKTPAAPNAPPGSPIGLPDDDIP